MHINRPNFEDDLSVKARQHRTETALDNYQGFDYIIENDGVVYGAIQEKPLEVKHSRATNYEEISLMRKSKYLHSSLKGIFEKVAKDLEKGKLVLFTGIGCQIVALKNYLGCRDVTNLILCDVVCHGMPITESWNKYISGKEKLINAKIKELPDASLIKV